MPPPPTSTLFPYTTLFRSAHHAVHGVAAAASNANHFDAGAGVALVVQPQSQALGIVSPGSQCLVVGGQDRKSTRLNSSHGYISYAVFCLKKKTATTRARPV